MQVNIKTPNVDVLEVLEQKGYDKLTATLFANRCGDVNKIEPILSNNKDAVPDLSKLKNAELAASIIYSNIVEDNLIIISNDYDADGVSSGGFGERCLKEYFGVTDENLIVIQNERNNGNGVNNTIVDEILTLHARRPVGLVITADHGSADDERYLKLKKQGIKIVVTDHHAIPNTGVPINVDAFVNPQQEGDEFSKNISGCTVLYFMFRVLYNIFLSKNKLKDYQKDELDSLLVIVTNTIITDQMNLSDPINRYLLNRGLKLLNESKDAPWGIIKSLTNLNSNITEEDIGFVLGPILNAAGRMDRAYIAQKFLASNTEYKATKYLKEMIDLNIKRKEQQTKVTTIAREQARSYTKHYKNTLVIVLNEGHGIAGIIAGNIGEAYNKPIFVMVDVGDGVLVGSGRSINPNIDIEKSINYIKEKDNDVIIRGGGHKNAAGCSINKNKLKDFFELFEESIVKQYEYIDDISGIIFIDAEIPVKFIGKSLLNTVNNLRPYGNGWEKPLFKSRCILSSVKPIGILKQHLLVDISTGEGFEPIKGVYFNYDKKIGTLNDGDEVDILYNINQSKKPGTVEVMIKNIIK